MVGPRPRVLVTPPLRTVVDQMGSTRLTSMCYTYAQNMWPQREIDVTVTGRNRLFVWSYKHRCSFARCRIKLISFINSTFGNITSYLNGWTVTPNPLKPSGHYMYRTVVTICTASLTFNNSSFCPHTVFMCFVWISEQTAIISLYNINWLVFITEI